jgi:hypothetical protein
MICAQAEAQFAQKPAARQCGDAVDLRWVPSFCMLKRTLQDPSHRNVREIGEKGGADPPPPMKLGILTNMKTKHFLDSRTRLCGAVVYIVLTLCMAGSGAFGQAPANVSPDVQQIVKLSQAQMSDDVIVSFIKNSGKAYHLSSDDVLYLNSQGVSQNVIAALLQAKPSGTPAPPPAVSTQPPVQTPVPAPPTAPPEVAPTPPAMALATPPPTGLFDSFSSEASLNPALWTPQSDFLRALAGASGCLPVMPVLAFGPAGMQMSGISGPAQFMGVQSINTFFAPFTFTAVESGLAARAIPFEVYLVSPDLRQWISVAGHLGGHEEAADIRFGGGVRGVFRGGIEIPVGGESPDHGVWLNYTTSGLPISMLGQRIFDRPMLGVPYTVQISVGADGLASVSLVDPAGVPLGARAGLSVGSGPFYVVLAGRNGPTFASWQSVRLNSPMAAVAAAPVPETPTIAYFQSELSPYGTWTTLPELGLAWMPSVASADPLWRPYLTQGHWTYSDCGWYWQSDYQWGDIVFHYGRWVKDARTGWVWAWVPGYNWAPSWVCWRYDEADGVCGWAPLPASARFEAGVGLYFNGGLAVDVDFGLRPEAFVFVGFDHFWEPDFRAFVVGPERANLFFARSVVRNAYRFDHGVFRVEGLGRERMAALSHHEIRAAAARDLRRSEEHEHAVHRAQEHARIRVDEHRAPERPEERRASEASRPNDPRTPQQIRAAAAKKGTAVDKDKEKEKERENNPH